MNIIEEAKEWLGKDKDNKVILRFLKNNPMQVINNFEVSDLSRISTTANEINESELSTNTKVFTETE